MSAASDATPLSRRRFLMAGMLAGGVALSEGLRLAQSSSDVAIDVDALTPAAIGAWRRVAGPEMILAEQAEGSTFYEQEVARTYAGAGVPLIMLAIAYGSRQDERLEVHRPETCYPAQGFQVADARSIDLALTAETSIPARFLVARRQDRTEQIVYWTRIGQRFPRTSAEQKLAMLRSSLALTIPDGMLVRLSTLGTAEDQVPAMAEFARLLLRSSPAALRQALAGPLASALSLERS